MQRIKNILLTGISIALIILASIWIYSTNKDNSENLESEGTKLEQIVYLDDEQTVSLKIPSSWTSEKGNEEGENNFEEIRIYPEESNKDKYLSLRKQKDVGVCGTGLTTKKLELKEGKEATVGYYKDENKEWSFVAFDKESELFSFNAGLKGEEAKIGLEILQEIEYK